MKTAQGSISVDVSKFVAGIELATAKLLTLREAIERSSAVARSGFRIYDAVQAVASKLNSIKEQWKNIADAISFVKNVSQNVPKIFDSIRSTAQGALNAIKNMPPLFQKLAVTVAAAGIAFYALKKGMDAINSIGKSVASAIGSIAGKVTSLAKAGISGVGGILSGAFEVLGSVAKTAGISIGGVGLALGALDRFFKIGITSAIELGDEYNTLSKRTGASVGYLYDLGKILKNNGSSSTYAATAISHMQRALTGVNELGQPTAEIFKQLGLNAKDLQNDAPRVAVDKLGKAILNLKNPALQARAATEVFGKAGTSMIAAFKDEEFAKISQNTSSAGQSLEKNAENFSRIASKLRDSGSFFREFFISLAGEIAPEILELFKMFQGGDTLSKFGKDLGSSIKKGLDVIIGAFKTGNLLEMLKAVFDIVSAYGQDLLSRAFITASNILTKIFESNVIPSIFSAFTDMLSGLAEFIAGIFFRAFKEPILFFKNAFDNIVQEIVVSLAEGLIQAVLPFGSLLKKAGLDVGKMVNVRGALEATGMILSPDQINQKNEGNIDTQIAKATGKGTGISAVAQGAKSLYGTAKDIFQILNDELSKMGNMTPETAKKIADATGKLNAYAIAAQVTGVATAEATGQAELGVKTGKSEKTMNDVAVSSLQRIGGGGGAFGGDPLLKVSEDQLSESKQQTKLLNQIYTSFSGVGYSPAYQSGEFATFR
jgi:hypothetical protein